MDRRYPPFRAGLWIKQEGEIDAKRPAPECTVSPSVLSSRVSDAPSASHPSPSPHELQQVLEEWGALEVFLHCNVPKGTRGRGGEAAGWKGDRGMRLARSRWTLTSCDRLLAYLEGAGSPCGLLSVCVWWGDMRSGLGLRAQSVIWRWGRGEGQGGWTGPSLPAGPLT